MSLPNRVTPYGVIVTSDSRGTLMGNRGVLHDANYNIVRSWKHKSWITCLLEFGDVQRQVMSPCCYTELFFTDEATAFSAGHRPCAECQRDRFQEFKDSWLTANAGMYPLGNVSIAEIDKVMHVERIIRTGEKVTFTDRLGNLPDGAFIEREGAYLLKWKDKILLKWGFSGYLEATELQDDTEVRVLTPKSVVRTFKAGFTPNVHSSVIPFITHTAHKAAT